jgi:outer membrane protein assembly factor BamB
VHVGGAVKGSPAYSGGLLVVGSYDGHVSAWNARTGHELWRTAGLGRYGGLEQGHFYSTPTIAYGRVYIGSTDGRVYSLVASTGQIAWTAQTGSYVYAGPAVVHQTILIGSYDGWFYAFNARTGARRWRFKADARISGSATVVDDIVYFSTFGNGSFGLDVNNGREVWRSHQGRYSPVVATRDAFYFVGYNTLRRLRQRKHPAGRIVRADGTIAARGGHAFGRVVRHRRG